MEGEAAARGERQGDFLSRCAGMASAGCRLAAREGRTVEGSKPSTIWVGTIDASSPRPSVSGSLSNAEAVPSRSGIEDRRW